MGLISNAISIASEYPLESTCYSIAGFTACAVAVRFRYEIIAHLLPVYDRKEARNIMQIGSHNIRAVTHKLRIWAKQDIVSSAQLYVIRQYLLGKIQTELTSAERIALKEIHDSCIKTTRHQRIGAMKKNGVFSSVI